MSTMKKHLTPGSAISEALSEPWDEGKKEGAISLIRHLQKMLAYQQLSMERYNTAVALASGSPSGPSMPVERQSSNLSNPTLVSQYIIPALEYKIGLIRLMKDRHEQIDQLITKEIRRPYEDMSVVISLMRERVDLQYEGFKSFVKNLEFDSDITRLDQAETAAFVRAAQSLTRTSCQGGLDGAVE